MTALYITLAIILLLLLFLHIPFRLYISYHGKQPNVVIKYLFFRKILVPKREKSKKKEKKTSDKKKEKKDKDKKKNSFIPDSWSDRLQLIINLLKASGKAFKVFTKRIKLTKICIDFDISDEDACECAVKFGKINAAIYNIYAFASCWFKVKKDHININCVYNKPESIYDLSLIVKVSPSAAILAVLAFIFKFLVYTIKAKLSKKQVQPQKA